MKLLIISIFSIISLCNCATKSINYASNCKTGWSEVNIKGELIADSSTTINWLESECEKINEKEYLTNYRTMKGWNTWGSRLIIKFNNSDRINYTYFGCVKSKTKATIDIKEFIENSIVK